MIELIIAAATAAVAAPGTPVSLHGIGPLRIGMPVAALRRIGARTRERPEEPGGCHYWRLPGRDGLALMVVRNRLVRIDISNPAYRMISGAGVGMTEAEIGAIYGARLRAEPHPYTGPEGHYLIYRARNEPYGLIFETSHENGRPLSMRVGYWENVQWIEGCS